jgi:hypothetical protein
MPGPIPKRSEERTRRNKTNESGIAVKKGEATPISWPHPAKHWDKSVKDLYQGMKKSGMAQFYQQAEVQWAWLACDELNEYRQRGGGAMKLQAVLSMFSQGLGITEGDRRRMQIELEIPEKPVEPESRSSKVTNIQDRINKRAG